MRGAVMARVGARACAHTRAHVHVHAGSALCTCSVHMLACTHAYEQRSMLMRIRTPAGSLARTIWGDHGRYLDTYLKPYPGYYFTGDGCRRDKDGYIWITGRVDDVLNVSGHRLGTAEIESALVLYPDCVEAAVVGMPHDIKGQGVFA